MRPGLGARRESWAGRWYLLPPLKFLPLTSWHYTQSYARAQTPDHPCVSVRLPRPSIRLHASCGEDADGFSHLSQLERRRYVFDLICFMDSGRAPPRSGRCSPDNSGPLALRSQFMYLGRWGECAHTARGWRDESGKTQPVCKHPRDGFFVYWFPFTGHVRVFSQFMSQKTVPALLEALPTATNYVLSEDRSGSQPRTHTRPGRHTVLAGRAASQLVRTP